MSNTFPKTRGSARGYDVEQVEDFLQEARTAFDSSRTDVAMLRARDIRRTSFPLQKGGYSIAAVDAALERLEDAFAAREKEIAIARGGQQAWLGEARTTAQVVLDRLDRGAKHRFARAGLLRQGYKRKDVDAFADRLVDYFQTGKPLSVAEVRKTTFRRQSNGYLEAQVDDLLDAVIDAMLAVR